MPRWWSWLVLPQRAKTYGFNSIADIGEKKWGGASASGSAPA